MRLSHGEKVIVTQEIREESDDYSIVLATKGSIAVVITIEEFRDYYISTRNENPPEHVIKELQEGTLSLVRFLTIKSRVQSSSFAYPAEGDVDVEPIAVLPVSFLQLISNDKH